MLFSLLQICYCQGSAAPMTKEETKAQGPMIMMGTGMGITIRTRPLWYKNMWEIVCSFSTFKF